MGIREIIDAFGGGSELAADLGCGPPAISNWLKDGSIPRGRWPDLIEIAERKGIPNITLGELRRAHAPQPSAEAA